MNEFSLANLGQPETTQPVEPSQPTGQKIWTEVELQDGVNAGTITQAVADQTLESQRQEALVDGVANRIQTQQAAADRAATVASEVGSYVTQHPELKNKDSAHFKKAGEEFTKLTALGYDKDDPATELLALKAAFGPVTVAKGTPSFEVHQEGGSGQGGSEPSAGGEGAGDPASAPPGLSDRQASHYSHLIDVGIMPDWNAVREELKFADQGIMKRALVMNA